MPHVYEVRIRMFFADPSFGSELASADYYITSDMADDFCVMGFQVLPDLIGIERTDYV